MPVVLPSSPIKIWHKPVGSWVMIGNLKKQRYLLNVTFSVQVNPENRRVSNKLRSDIQTDISTPYI